MVRNVTRDLVFSFVLWRIGSRPAGILFHAVAGMVKRNGSSSETSWSSKR